MTNDSSSNSIIHDSWIDFNKNGSKEPYEDPQLPNTQRIADLLSRMQLNEKVLQLLQSSGDREIHLLQAIGGMEKAKEILEAHGIKKIRKILQNLDDGIKSEGIKKIREFTQVIKGDEAEKARQGIGSFLNVTSPKKTNKLQKIAIEETRLGIPLLFGFDSVHGHVTTFPVPIGEASTWNLSLVQQNAVMIAREASADGINWVFSPILDIARDARWGRVVETFGEDVYLVSRMGVAKTKGYQGQDLSNKNTVLACPKHFAAYSASIGGRDYNSADLSRRTLREVYLPPFEAAIDAGAGSVMSAYIDINGIPASCNNWLLEHILRHEWEFDGILLSDWTAVEQLIQHGLASTEKQAAKLAINAGVDMEMTSTTYESLPELVKKEEVSEETINQAVRRILTIKFRLGLFDPPVYLNPRRKAQITHSNEIVTQATKAARESIVLLENQDSTLPLNPHLDSLAVIGPLANNKEDLLGSWAAKGKQDRVITVLEGIKKQTSPRTTIHYEKGCPISQHILDGFQEAIQAVKKANVAVLVLGESRHMTGEASSRASIELPGVQKQLINTLKEQGTPLIGILINGRPLSINPKPFSGLIEAWFPGERGGVAIADVLFGEYNPGGRLPITIPQTVGQEPLYYAHKPTAQPWYSAYKPAFFYDTNLSKEYSVSFDPLYPFGYGLSYTEFEYQGLDVPEKVYHPDQIPVTVSVKNIGERRGDTVVQIYARDKVASVTRPVKELKAFKKIGLEPGEEQHVEFHIPTQRFYLINPKNERVVEPGTFTLMLGKSSTHIIDSKKIEIG